MKSIGAGIVVVMALIFMPLATGAQEEPAAEAVAEQQRQAAPPETPLPADMGMHEEMMAHCEAMMEHCKAMVEKRAEAMKEVEAMDARLDERIAAMNAAEGEEKVEAMAAVINEMVAQRGKMREKFHGMRAHPMCPMMMQGHGMRGRHMGPMMQHRGSPPVDAANHH